MQRGTTLALGNVVRHGCYVNVAEFPVSVIERLGYYVYTLADPTQSKVREKSINLKKFGRFIPVDSRSDMRLSGTVWRKQKRLKLNRH